MQIYTEKIRIYPNRSQRILIDKRLTEATKLWDCLVEVSRKELDVFGRAPNYKALCNLLNNHHKEIRLPSIIRYGVAKRLETAWTLFFEACKEGNKRHVHPPKLKNNQRTKSFTYVGKLSKNLIGSNLLWLDRELGSIRAKFSREISGKPKTVTIKKLKSGKYYAFLAVEGSPAKQKSVPLNRSKQVGIDPGVLSFSTLSDGTVFKPEFFSSKEQRKIRRAQRELSRRIKGSLGYKKTRLKLARLHEDVANKRLDFQWKLALWLVMNYEVICLEKTELKSMFQSAKKKRKKSKKKKTLKLASLFPRMQDMSHFQFREILSYLSGKYGSELILIDPKFTSQTCSRCHCLVPKSLNQRQHICPHCGLSVDRDLNAAMNILERGLRSVKGTVGTTGTVEIFVKLIISKTNLDSTTLVETSVPGFYS